MTGSLVDRATTDLLIGPDWAMNLEICEILNHNPGLAKDVVKGLKRRIGHKNPKVQILALTLLETIVKNCGDIVHMHVAEKELPHKMVKIVKKKPDFKVKEKILGLIDIWQEAFGGPRARYLQYYAAYQELLHAGAVFPKRPDGSTLRFTSLQKHPVSANPESSGNSDYQQEAPEASAGSDFSTLSLAEIENARSIVDVFSEMLTALDPGNKEGLRQDVIVDLVQQCRAYKQRLVHLVNTTSDEDLLCQGLALNDDLQRVLAKHDALVAGVAVRVEKKKSLQALVDIDDSDASTQPDQRSTINTSDQLPLEQLLLTDDTTTPAAGAGPHTDLLSGDFEIPAAENSLALVPVGKQLSGSATEQNALVLADMFSHSNNNNGTESATGPFDSTPRSTLNPNGSIANSGLPQYEQSIYQGDQPNYANPAWNGQPFNSVNDALPPPPWETQPAEVMDPQINHQAGMMYLSPMQSTPQQGLMYPSHLHNNQMTMQGAHPSGFPPGYDQRPQYPSYANSQGMQGLPMQDNYGYSYQMPTSSVSRPSKPEDKLFGDLVTMAKSKQK